MPKRITFQGLQILIENPVGSIRKGNGWQVEMQHAYGEIVGSMGVDGDPVDVFIGNNPSAKFVYIVHILKHDGTGFDEQKCFMGFDDVLDAKQAFFKNYDKVGAHLYTDVETIPLDVFKKKVMESKSNPIPIHASEMNKTIALYAEGLSSGGAGIGTPVTVDGEHGRGVIVRINGRNITVRFRSGLYITRDVGSVHALSDNYYKNRYMTRR